MKDYQCQLSISMQHCWPCKLVNWCLTPKSRNLFNECMDRIYRSLPRYRTLQFLVLWTQLQLTLQQRRIYQKCRQIWELYQMYTYRNKCQHWWVPPAKRIGKNTKTSLSENNILEELRLRTAGISNYTNINVPSQVDAFMSKLMDTTQEHKQDCTLDVLVTKNSWTNAINNLIKEIRCVPHLLNFI